MTPVSRQLRTRTNKSTFSDMPKDDSDSSSTLDHEEPPKRSISPSNPPRFAITNTRNIKEEIAEADATSSSARRSPEFEKRESLIQRIASLERTVQRLSAVLERQQQSVENDRKYAASASSDIPAEVEYCAMEESSDIECLSHEHLKNLEWALGCITICDFDLDDNLNGQCSTRQDDNNPFAAPETEQSQLKLRQMCEALCIGVKAMIQAVRVGKDSIFGDERHLISACQVDPEAVVVLMEKGVEDMGRRLGYGPFGPAY
jgi:hypothetical protein